VKLLRSSRVFVNLDPKLDPKFPYWDLREGIVEVQTNDVGYYEFEDLSPGRYEVVATRRGSDPAREKLDVKEKDSLYLPFTLEASR
jgi:hypothetical protein